MNLAPIVLFTYNRPLHTKQTVEALKLNSLATESDLYIYSDAPKKAEALAAVESVRAYLKTVTGFKNVSLVFRDRNYGLADSIVDGVTTAVKKYGKVIVLEDDIVTSPHFLSYMNEALEIYQDNEKVMHVSGYFFPVDTSTLPQTFFYNQTSCWGWGTWARAWQNYTSDPQALLNEITKSKRLKEFDMDGNFRFSSALKANIRGDIKTWAIKWHASVFLKNGLCLHPKNSLTFNSGHDGSGTNSGQTSLYNTLLTDQSPLPLERMPLEENPHARKIAISFLKSSKPSIIKRIINKIWK